MLEALFGLVLVIGLLSFLGYWIIQGCKSREEETS